MFGFFVKLQILQKLTNAVGSFYKILCGKTFDVGFIYSIITFQNIDCLIFFRFKNRLKRHLADCAFYSIEEGLDGK